MRETTEAETEIQAVDITGEKSNGRTSSAIIKCEKCSYKSTMKDRMKQHVRGCSYIIFAFFGPPYHQQEQVAL